ncbi:hypothetical protein WMF26_06805 [Sorangium sp. So ce185]|uniref:hypothetical protein n=1 Tax=Sorangium sp. So ce185 TaxID=3133287 RepID=UPI003F644DBF
MRRSLIPMLLSSVALAAAACSSTPPQPVETPTGASSAETPRNAGPETVPNTREASEEDDLCSDQQPTGDPPVCPPGCIWSGPKQKCIQDRGVIVDQRPEEPVRDPRPAPTLVPKPAPTSIQPPASTPSK